jgi:RND family efflux transporter MFP subunit
VRDVLNDLYLNLVGKLILRREAALRAKILVPYFGALALAAGSLTVPIIHGQAHAQMADLLVRVDEVRVAPLTQSVPVIGRLVANRLGDVAARINGPVDAFKVEVGDRIEGGQVLAVLDATALQARYDLAAGRLREAQAERAVKRAELALAKQDFQRLERLKASAAFNQARYDDSRQQVAITEASVSQADAAIAEAEAELRLAEINLYNAEVRAPYAGVVTQRLTEAGSYVQVGQAVLRMLGDQSLEVEADVPFQNLAGLEPGIQVNLTLDDGTAHTAVVRAILPAENPLTRTRMVRLVPNIAATRRTLAHDQSVTLQVPVGAERQVLSVHKDAVIIRRGQDMAFVVVDGAVEARPITLGEALGNRFEVRNGLAAGDKAVVRGNERLKPGDKVKIAGDQS